MISVSPWLRVGIAIASLIGAPAHGQDAPPRPVTALAACPSAAAAVPRAAADVTVTFYGVSTLMFSDGTDRILIDGFVSRPPVTQFFGLRSDPGAVRLLLGPDRPPLRAVFTAHAHHDHALDTAAIAREVPEAQMIGTRSLKTLMRRQGMEGPRFHEAADGEVFQFGDFVVTTFKVDHGPSPAILRRILDHPLADGHGAPGWFGDYKDDENLSFLIVHGRRRILVHPSAGVRDLACHRPDTVFMGLGRVGAMTDPDAYFSGLIAPETRTIVPIHWDRFTTRMGAPLQPMPSDRIPETLRLLCRPTGPTATRDIRMMDAGAVMTLGDAGTHIPSGGRHWNACIPSTDRVTVRPSR